MGSLHDQIMYIFIATYALQMLGRSWFSSNYKIDFDINGTANMAVTLEDEVIQLNFFEDDWGSGVHELPNYEVI